MNVLFIGKISTVGMKTKITLGLSDTGRQLITDRLGKPFHMELDPVTGFTFSLILTMTDESDVLNREFITEYLWLRQTLEALTVHIHDNYYTYSQLCYKVASTVISKKTVKPIVADR